MAGKMVAVFLMCVVVVAAMHVQEAEAMGEVFKPCYEECQKDCQASGNGNTFCEMKCDTDCSLKENAGTFSPHPSLSPYVL
ncbi:hypothetical protein Acr_13g0002100 [Actinidia rufa]|uniref:Plant thionin family protein n=1 Tax=Actinidia rufa TaxID=165716 RepID=A0A7J0FKX6_9ERIC|nr:hypothetical protein Acr_13g0002100 [Actinidia rufa]